MQYTQQTTPNTSQGSKSMNLAKSNKMGLLKICENPEDWIFESDTFGRKLRQDLFSPPQFLSNTLFPPKPRKQLQRHQRSIEDRERLDSWIRQRLESEKSKI